MSIWLFHVIGYTPLWRKNLNIFSLRLYQSAIYIRGVDFFFWPLDFIKLGKIILHTVRNPPQGDPQFCDQPSDKLHLKRQQMNQQNNGQTQLFLGKIIIHQMQQILVKMTPKLN